MLRTLAFITRHPLTADRPVSAIQRFAAWQIASRLRKALPFRWIDGSQLIVERGMTGATGNIYCGLHEFADMGLLLHLLRPGDLFVDIGANIGSYTVLASKVCGARTLAFEPDPLTAARLLRNIKANGIDQLVEVQQVALGEADGEIRFTQGLDTVNRVAGPGDAHVQIVQQRRLDGLAAAKGATLIKLDVEGHEEAVLRGAEEVLSSPSLLALETEGRGPVILETLTRHGFSEAYYDPFSRTLSRAPNGLPRANLLFVRDQAEVDRRVQSAPRRRVLHHSV